MATRETGRPLSAFEVHWEPGPGLLTTRTRGLACVEDVARYRAALDRTLAAVASGASFVWLSNASGYEPLANRAVHEAVRAIVPQTLAEHGFRTSLLDLYEPTEVATVHTGGATCRAVAHVHHDAEKMSILDQRIGRDRERYFADESLARAWLTEGRWV